MVKVLVDDPLFQIGSYTGQKTPGLYMDGMLVELIDIFGRKITNDMQFFGTICSSTFGVRTGKSTLAQQIGYYYTKEVNRLNGLNIPFDHNNIVFSSKDLIKKAETLPKYSCIILDESDDLTEHSLSQTMKEVQKYFNKSGQLNHFIIAIIPDFFSLPKGLAMSRSNFLIDVRFEGEFERGHFNYYNFRDKKKLYVRGKKYHDYDIQQPTIRGGRFVNKYCVDEDKYRQMKLDDLHKREVEENEEHIPAKIERKVESQIFTKVYKCAKLDKNMTVKELSKWFGRSERTGHRYLAENADEELHLITHGKIKKESDTLTETKNNVILTSKVEGQGDKSGAEVSQPSNRIPLNSWEALKQYEND